MSAAICVCQELTVSTPSPVVRNVTATPTERMDLLNAIKNPESAFANRMLVEELVISVLPGTLLFSEISLFFTSDH